MGSRQYVWCVTIFSVSHTFMYPSFHTPNIGIYLYDRRRWNQLVVPHTFDEYILPRTILYFTNSKVW